MSERARRAGFPLVLRGPVGAAAAAPLCGGLIVVGSLTGYRSPASVPRPRGAHG